MTLHQIRKVDLKASVWTREKSDITKGKIDFKKKVYIGYSRDNASRPEWLYLWNRNSPAEIQTWQYKWEGCDIVRASDLEVWPEGVIPKADDTYVYKDSILMKVPIRAYIIKRKEELARSESRPAALKQSLSNELKSQGMAVPDATIDEWMSEFKE
jgi:hypothetical protein